MGASVECLIPKDSQPSSFACTSIKLNINETDWSIGSQLMRHDCWDPTGHRRLCPPSQMNQESQLLSSSLCFLCFYSTEDAVDENRLGACSWWTFRPWTGSVASTLTSWLWILTSTTSMFSWFHVFLQASHQWALLVGIPGRSKLISCSGSCWWTLSILLQLLLLTLLPVRV